MQESLAPTSLQIFCKEIHPKVVVSISRRVEGGFFEECAALQATIMKELHESSYTGTLENMNTINNYFRHQQEHGLSWFDKKTEYSQTALAWMTILLMVSRTISLNDGLLADSDYVELMRTTCQWLVSMPSLTVPMEFNDQLEIKRAMRLFLFHLVSVEAIPLDKAAIRSLYCITEFTSLELWNGMNFEWDSKKRGSSYGLKLVSLWNQCVSLQDNIIMQTTILNECISRQNYTFCLALIQDSPQVAMILLASILNAVDRSLMKSSTSRRFVLEYLDICFQHLPSVSSGIFERVLLMALNGTDSIIRCLAFRILAKYISKIEGNSRIKALTLAVSSITVNEQSKNVFLSGLRFVNMALIQNDQDGIEVGIDAKRSLEMLIITVITRPDGNMPVHWKQAIYPFICRGFDLLNIEFFVRAYRNSNQAMSNIFIDAYAESLSAKRDTERQQRLLDLACLACKGVTMESFIFLFTKDLVARASVALSAMLLINIQLALRFICGFVSTERLDDPDQLDCSIVLCTLLMGCSGFESTRNRFANLSATFIKTIDKVLLTDCFSARRPYQITRHCLQFLRINIENQSSRTEASFQIIQKHLAPLAETLLLNADCQSEFVKLCYCTHKEPQKEIFYGLAYVQVDLSVIASPCQKIPLLNFNQEAAVKNISTFIGFLDLLGIVARENSYFIAKKVSERKSNQRKNGEIDDYMLDHKSQTWRKRQIRSEHEESVNKGLLSAYLPLLSHVLTAEGSLLKECSQTVQMQCSAVRTLGEFMRISHSVVDARLSLLLDLIKNQEKPDMFRKSVIDVWASLQSHIKPSTMKEKAIDDLYALFTNHYESEGQDSGIQTHLLTRLLALIRCGQLRDDKLHCFILPLISNNKTYSSMLDNFFRQYFRKKSSPHVVRLLFDQYSSSQSSMRDKPKHFEAIKALVRIARESNVNLSALELGLVSECECVSRQEQALELLIHLCPLAPGAIKSLLQARNMMEGEPNKQLCRILMKSLPRCKDSTMRGAIMRFLESRKCISGKPTDRDKVLKNTSLNAVSKDVKT